MGAKEAVGDQWVGHYTGPSKRGQYLVSGWRPGSRREVVGYGICFEGETERICVQIGWGGGEKEESKMRSAHWPERPGSGVSVCRVGEDRGRRVSVCFLVPATWWAGAGPFLFFRRAQRGRSDRHFGRREDAEEESENHGSCEF